MSFLVLLSPSTALARCLEPHPFFRLRLLLLLLLLFFFELIELCLSLKHGLGYALEEGSED